LFLTQLSETGKILEGVSGVLNGDNQVNTINQTEMVPW